MGKQYNYLYLKATLALFASCLFLSSNVTAAVDDNTLSVKASASKHASYRFDTWKQLAHKWRMLGKTGMRLKDIEVLEHSNGKRIYSGVWEPGNGKHALYRYSSWSAFVDKWDELNDKDYRLVDIERVKHGNKFWYYGVWRAGSDKFALYRYNSWSSFTTKWSELNGDGYRLVDIDVTEHNNTKTYIGVWRAGSGKYALFNYSSWSNLTSKWAELGPQGYQLADMDIVRLNNGTTRYVGVWRAGSKKRALYRYTNWTAFKKKWADLAEKGYSLLDVEVAERTATGSWYVGSFGPAPRLPRSGPDLSAMAEYLEDNFGQSVVGMSYAIGQNGQLALAGSTGSAQRFPDSNIAMTSKIRSTVASVSKTVTAPLVYKLLNANGLTIDSLISPWLPSTWDKGPGFTNNINGLTFRHLLTHTSGLNQEFLSLQALGLSDPWGNDWDGLNFVVNIGTNPGQSRSYKNANFALLRVLIPELWKAAGGPGGNITEGNVGQRFLSYLHKLVLDSEAISSVACWPQAGYPEAKSYNFANNALAGASNSSSIDGCGGHAGLHFSAQELTQYAMAFRFDDKIMSPADRTTMKLDRAGWGSENAVVGGDAYSHGGAWNRGSGRKTRTCIMELPYNVNASIIFNSLPTSSACWTLRQAYDASF